MAASMIRDRGSTLFSMLMDDVKSVVVSIICRMGMRFGQGKRQKKRRRQQYDDE